MSERSCPDRRRLLGLLLSAAASALLAGRGAAGPLDQGIGGTGVAPPTDESDRGIGGTGVIGTIRKFGSIVVNDLRISYPADVAVRIDGRPASVRDLKIGQVVRVAASGPDSSLSTRTIDVTSEVVGPVEKLGTDRLTVLGQSVSTTGLDIKSLKAGDIVAVSGLRRNDGTIVASLVEPRPGAVSRVAGPLTRAPGGAMRIGGLTVADVAPDLVGHRVVLVGRSEGARFIATRSAAETSLLPRKVRTFSIESYVERRGDRLQLGSGFAVDPRTGLDVPEGRAVLAVLRTRIGSNGRLRVEGFRTVTAPFGGGRGPGGGGPGRGGPGRGGPGRGFRGPGGRDGFRGPRNWGGPGRFGGPGGGFRGPRGFGGPGRFGGPGGFRGPRGFGGPGRFGGPGGFRGGGGRGFGGGGFRGGRR